MKKGFRPVVSAIAVFLAAGCVSLTVHAEQEPHLKWLKGSDGKDYWYEDGTKQGTLDDRKGVLGEGTIRGREICDPATNNWYWLDAVYDGAKAVNKEVWMPYIFQDEETYNEKTINDTGDWCSYESAVNTDHALTGEQIKNAIRNKAGKWVRYNSEGAMVKGWYTVTGNDLLIYPKQAGNTYYYDRTTGLMAKGWTEIDGVSYYFDELTGVLEGAAPAGVINIKGPDVIPGNIFNVRDYGAVPDDNTNDTEAFMDAMIAAGCDKSKVPNAKTIYFPAGRYNIDPVNAFGEKGFFVETYYLNYFYGDFDADGLNFIFHPDAVLEVAEAAAEEKPTVFFLNNAADIVIFGGKIVGDRGYHEGRTELSFGISLLDARNVMISDMEITSVRGDAIAMSSASYEDALPGCDNIRVRRCELTDSVRSNVSVVDADNVVFDSCLIKNAHGRRPQCGIMVEPDYTGAQLPDERICKNIRIVNTEIFVHDNITGDKEGQFFCFESHKAPSIPNYTVADNVEIRDCRMHGDVGNFSITNFRMINTSVDGHFYNER